MTTSTVTSIVFTTASGRPVEVSCAQMEIARNRLWGSDFQVPSCSSSSAKATDQPPKNSSTEEKENEYNFFDDDDFDDDFDLLMETFVPVSTRIFCQLIVNNSVILLSEPSSSADFQTTFAGSDLQF